jgi:predicted phosphohydrolase
LHAFGIGKCYFGHIHGMYAVPAKTVLEEIEFHMISADYLDFIPKRL